MQYTQFVCQHISPYADYFNILIVSSTNIHTHYVHIHAYPHITYVYSCTHTYKQTHTHFCITAMAAVRIYIFKICCPMPIKRKPAQIIVDMNAHMWWVFIKETVVAASSCWKGFTYSHWTGKRQSNESAWKPRLSTSWNQKQDQFSPMQQSKEPHYTIKYAFFRAVFYESSKNKNASVLARWLYVTQNTFSKIKTEKLKYINNFYSFCYCKWKMWCLILRE